MKTAGFFLSLIFATCTAQKSGVGGDTNKQGQGADIGLSFVAGDAYSGTETAETLVITDAKSLQKFYSRVNRTRKPGLPLPDIDFSKDMAIVRCSGVTDDDATPNLYVWEVTDDEIVLGIKDINGKSASSAITTPFVVYRMPRTDKEVNVEERE